MSLSFPAGLGLYWAVSSIIGIIAQYFITGGWGYLKLRSPFQSTPVKEK
jgi:membrane protein insertase Oxa1/YidC/SpoIIIJ